MNSWKQWENPKQKAWALLAPRASISAQPSPLTASSENTGHLGIINPEQLRPGQLMGTKAMGDAVPSLSLQPPSLGTCSQPRGESFGFIITSLPLPALRVQWKRPPCFTPLTMDASPSGTKPGGFPLPGPLEERTDPGLTQFCRDSPCPASQQPQWNQRGPRDTLTLSHGCPVGAPELPNAPGECPVPREGGQEVSRSCWCFPPSPSPRTRGGVGVLDISISPS